LQLDGEDLRGLPLIERTARLAKLMTRSKDPALGLVPSFDDGQALLLACTDKGVEGIVSKLRDAPYRPGSRPEWLKIKCPGWTAQNRDRWEKLRG
jgi:bifunctional non-homologous end joining protein LigD